MVGTQIIAGPSSEDHKFILFAPNFGELEEECLLAPQT